MIVLGKRISVSLENEAASSRTVQKTQRHHAPPEFDTASLRPVHQFCLHELFQAQAERTPEAIAVVFEKERLTYRQLNERANQLAHHLQEIGVGPDVLVGIHVERSLEMAIAILGVLKAGGAYVPLDPGYPADRLTAMIEDAKFPVLLTQEKFTNSLPPHDARTIRLDSDWHRIAQKPVTTPQSDVTPQNLIYVMYTSGSTGKPKGAMVLHSGVCNATRASQARFEITANDSLLQKTPFSFDVSAWEFFLPLISGARLIFARPGGHQDPEYLIDAIAEHAVTIIYFVPPMLRLFLEAKRLSRCSSLRIVECGGEPLPAALRDRFFTLLNAELYNLYGPTEASCDVTCWHCSPKDTDALVPIGRPIANNQIYLLNDAQQCVSTGDAGEVYIGGAGVGRGYWNRPELTAEKFVPDPFSPLPNAKMYRTGDLARWREDGNLDFIGRVDHQVKIRGFRIELGEIEATLGAHPRVREAVASARDDGHGNPVLVAYIVADQPPNGQEAYLRPFMESKLPEYMVPSHFVMMETLPLTPNGKVDKKALNAFPLSFAGNYRDIEGPQDDLERRLVGVWEKALERRPISVTDDFFLIGGHSLLAIRLLSDVEREFGARLALGAMMKAPTVRAMAALLRPKMISAAKEEMSAPVPAVSEDLSAYVLALQPNGTRPPLFCAPPGGGSGFFYRPLSRHISDDQPLYTFEPRGMGDGLTPLEIVEDIAAHYIRCMRTVQAEGPYYLGGFSFGGLVAFEMARQLTAANQRVALVALFDSWAPGYPVYKRSLSPSSWRGRLAMAAFWFGSFRDKQELFESRGEWRNYVRGLGTKIGQAIKARWTKNAPTAPGTVRRLAAGRHCPGSVCGGQSARHLSPRTSLRRARSPAAGATAVSFLRV